MRTTVEITAEQRAKLLALAAKRGQKGFSALVQEALDRYLEEEQKEEAIKKALAVRGSFSAEEADALEASCARARGSWR